VNRASYFYIKESKSEAEKTWGSSEAFLYLIVQPQQQHGVPPVSTDQCP